MTNDKLQMANDTLQISTPFSSLLLRPGTTIGVDDVAIFNNEQRLAIVTPPPSSTTTNDESIDSTDEDQQSQTVVPIPNDDHLFEEADMMYMPSDEGTNDNDDK